MSAPVGPSCGTLGQQHRVAAAPRAPGPAAADYWETRHVWDMKRRYRPTTSGHSIQFGTAVTAGYGSGAGSSALWPCCVGRPGALWASCRSAPGAAARGLRQSRREASIANPTQKQMAQIRRDGSLPVSRCGCINPHKRGNAPLLQKIRRRLHRTEFVS